jgi:hypothetical protein
MSTSYALNYENAKSLLDDLKLDEDLKMAGKGVMK